MGMLFRRSPAGTPSASTAAPAPQAGAAAQGEPVGGRGVRRLYDVLLFAPMLPVVLIVAVGFSLSVEGFATWANAQNMMRGLAVITIASLGATYVFLIGGLDLSVGATISLSSVMAAIVMRDTHSVPLGILTGVAAGVVVGAINGTAITRLRLTPFLHTLGMLLAVRAVAFIVSAGRSIGPLPDEAFAIGRGELAGIPIPFLIGAAIVALATWVLNRTLVGRRVYLIGASERAAAFSGLDVASVKFVVYLIAGTLSGIAGLVVTLRLGSGSPVAGDTLLLQVIGATVIGGTSLSGGEGGIMRTVFGALLITVLVNGLDLLGVEFWDEAIVIGVVILLGSALGSWLSQRRVGEARRGARAPAGQTTGVARG